MFEPTTPGRARKVRRRGRRPLEQSYVFQWFAVDSRGTLP